MPIPAAPSAVIAQPGLTDVILSWTPPPGPVTGYNVFFGTTSGAEYRNYQDLPVQFGQYSFLPAAFSTYANLFDTPVNGSLITGSTYTVTGLTNGVTYYFVVVAVNASGLSAPSVEVSAVPGLPTAPFIGHAVAGNALATVTWSPPTWTGGSAITGYTVTSYPDLVTASAGPTATSVVVTGLVNRRRYYFVVHASTSIGAGPDSLPTNPVTPESIPMPPSVSAIAQLDPLSGAPEIVVTVVADTTVTPADFTMTATLLRNDGTYVIGASPLDPLTVSLDTNMATVTDFAAPYGLETTYIGTITFSSPTPPVISPPSTPSSPVIMGQAPDTQMLYGRLGWATTEDVSGQLNTWLCAVGQMMQYVDSLCRDGYDTDGNPAPGWSQVLDIERCPTVALPWLAQFVGVRFDVTESDDTQRYLIKNPPGFARGSPAGLIAAANRYLQPGYTVTLTERDTSPYHLAISVPTAAILGVSTCRSLYEEYSACSSLPGAFATCADLWKTDSEIAAAINAAIPAGLVAAVSYV